MASRCLKLLRVIRNSSIVNRSITSGSIAIPEEKIITKAKELKIKEKFVSLDDPDSFGTLSRKIKFESNELQDEGDIKEERYLQNAPLSTQKLTTKQYADLIKQYLKYNRLKEAIDVLEVRMLTEDRVKPENYIYNILIGACADVGYTKKAFKLYNEMKRRALKPTGDTYTCLFHACANSPWPLDGLKHARNLKSLMVEKGVEPNLTNYNAIIKAFGRCGDLPTAFKIVDEMISKKIDIRVHTFNHLLHACIADKNTGLRHALVVWRKMLNMREKPNIYTFNLMLKCVKECNLGSKEDIEELIGIIQEQMIIGMSEKNKLIKSPDSRGIEQENPLMLCEKAKTPEIKSHIATPDNSINENLNEIQEQSSELIRKEKQNELICKENYTVSFMGHISKPMKLEEIRTVPNLLSKKLNMEQVLALQEVHTLHDKFAVIGGQEDFLKEMQVYNVNPDIKTFTQMLPLIEDTREAESKLLETMKNLNLKADIDFYNALIKKRCLRSDYEGAFDVRDIIVKEDKCRKKSHPHKKNIRLKLDIMSYGALALACKTKETAEKILNKMKEKKLKVNIQILGTLLRHGTAHSEFEYIIYIMNMVKEENIKVNDIFLKHLENFNDKCSNIVKDKRIKPSDTFAKAYKNFSHVYSKWLKEVDVQEALQPEHPWVQFQESYPETVQRQNVTIKEPKKFYKRKRKFVLYRV